LPTGLFVSAGEGLAEPAKELIAGAGRWRGLGKPYDT
jgi:hypothetical protein